MRLMRADPRAAMEQGGWFDIRSVIGYSAEMPEHRRRLVADLDDLRIGREYKPGKYS
jgi:hypothetical protein